MFSLAVNGKAGTEGAEKCEARAFEYNLQQGENKRLQSSICFSPAVNEKAGH